MEPIDKAPKDGTWIIGIWLEDNPIRQAPYIRMVRYKGNGWRDRYDDPIEELFSHFLPYTPPKPKRRIKLEGWINIYNDDRNIYGSYKSKEVADDNTDEKRFACINLSNYNIEVEEGEGL